MSVNLIYYKDGAKMMRPVLTRAEYTALRDSEQNQRADKHHMVQFNYSCQPDDPSATDPCPLKGCKTPSNTVGMDIDFNPEAPDYEQQMQEAPNLILSKKEELGLLMLERSASKGYHIVFRRHPELTQEENLKWASDLLGVEYDKGAKDITRVFFTPPTEKMMFLDDEIFKTEPTEPSEPTPDPSRKGKRLDTTEGKESATDSATVEVITPLPQREGQGEGPSYLGIPYSKIVDKWWELYNGGQTPVTSNRDVLTFELAVNLRHICGFDRGLMDRIIPRYDGFSQAQKMKCIDSALAEKRTQMPKRLRDVLEALQPTNLAAALTPALAPDADDEDFDAEESGTRPTDDGRYTLPRMPLGVRDSIAGAGQKLALPTLIATAPAIGALATGVKLDVHGQARGLNIYAFITGEFGSGKGQMDSIIGAWTNELQDEADHYHMLEAQWAEKAKCMKSGKTPEQPKHPVRIVPLVNTVPNIAERLGNTQGKHAYSFTCEADNVANKWKSSMGDFSVMVRQAYDESRYDREAKSADAVRVHIPHLRWNVTMCGTQDALYRVFSNTTDGTLSRVSIGRTPDNTFEALDDNPAHLTDLQASNIQQVAHLLPLMEGTVVLNKLEQRSREWIERIRLEAIKSDDRILARMRLRGGVNAMRITTALWLCRAAEILIRRHGFNGAEAQLRRDPGCWIEIMRKQQTEAMLRLFDIIADYLTENTLYYFRTRMERATAANNEQLNPGALRSYASKNDSIFSSLPDEFSLDQAVEKSVAFKGLSITRNSVRQMLKNWCKQGLIVHVSPSRYGKVREPLPHPAA